MGKITDKPYARLSQREQIKVLKILLSKEWSGGEGDFDFEKELKKELEALKGGSDDSYD